MLLNLITRIFITCPSCQGFVSIADFWEDTDAERCGLQCPDCGHRLEFIDCEDDDK